MSGLDPMRASRDIGGLPQAVVDAWILAERPNPVAFAVVAGASFFLAVPLFTGTDSVPSSPGVDPTLVAIFAASVENAVASGDVLVLGGGLLAGGDHGTGQSGEPGRGHGRTEGQLVHAQGRRRLTWSGVAEPGQVEQALEGPVSPGPP